jgi:trehalose 6-phosphate synthase/phosphatase
MSSIKRKPDRLIVVSNRLPVSISKKKDKVIIQPSPGGLATALRALRTEKKIVFFGWPGYIPQNNDEQKYIQTTLGEKHNCVPVFLSRTEIDKFYYGFSNRTLWPLFHYFASYCAFEKAEWEAYKRVNQKFFKTIIENSTEKDTFWIHDYHLMLLPHMLRMYFPNTDIGFFLHIPFPSSEIFRILPWRNEVLEGMLGSDLVGFHTYEYARHFLSSVLRLLGYEHEFGAISVGDRLVMVDNFPMGVDAQNIMSLLQQESTQKTIQRFEKTIEKKDRKVILSVDRLDYSKGIPHRLQAFESFLLKNPKWQEKLVYIMLCVPSRTKVRDYALLKQEVESMVGRINGRFGIPGWMPVYYLYRSFPFHRLLPLYAVADVALVTPVRDGMNLVAKEYVASRMDDSGVLILSGTAGAEAELGEALVVNVYNREALVGALVQALDMDEEEQKQRMRAMRQRIIDYDIHHWTRSFIGAIEEMKNRKLQREHRKLTGVWEKKLLSDYRGGKKCLLMFDYDGTLISFTERPQDAKPDTELMRLLLGLAKKAKNHLAIVSGRDRLIMEQWLGSIPCTLVAEHGAWVRDDMHSSWTIQKTLSTEWKSQVMPILKAYEARVPGSFVEDKELGLAWHYRKASPELGEIRSHELFDNLNEFLANRDLQLMHGKKVIEVRPGGISKGQAAQNLMMRDAYDFVLAIGDDWTDEDLFKVLPQEAYSIKVGYGTTNARFFLDSPQACRRLLKLLGLHKFNKKNKITS